MRRSLAIAAFSLLLLPSPACSDDCDELTEQVCARLGEQHEGCKRARKRNETATQEDKRLCGEALALTQRLTPKN